MNQTANKIIRPQMFSTADGHVCTSLLDFQSFNPTGPVYILEANFAVIVPTYGLAPSGTR